MNGILQKGTPAALLVLFALSLVACNDSNSLIAKWEDKIPPWVIHK